MPAKAGDFSRLKPEGILEEWVGCPSAFPRDAEAPPSSFPFPPFSRLHEAVMSRVASFVFGGFVACGLIVSASRLAFSADSASDSAAKPAASSVPDLFEAEERQLVSLRYIPNDAKSAQIIVTNRTRRPLTLRLPAAFAGIPVLAQMGGMGGMGGGGGQAGFAAGGIGGGPQATGGGGGMGGQGMNGMGGGGMGMGGGGAFSIPPERSRAFRVSTVCLEYGKREPSSRMPYKLGRAENFSSDPKLALVLESLGRGELSQKVAQAAAWHVANGLTWEKLAAEKIDHAGGIPDEPYFSQAELVAAHRVVAVATELAARRRPLDVSEASGKNGPAQ